MNPNEAKSRLEYLHTASYYAAVLFNTMFAILSTVTLLGIVFITRPKQVLHNVPPEWWIPLLVIMMPSQGYCQFLTWRTVFTRDTPSPLEIARSQKTPKLFFRFPLAFLWAANFLIGFVIVVSLYKPAPGNNGGMTGMLFVGCITFGLSCFANVYLMLFVRAASSSDATLRKVWDFRLVIDVAIAFTAVAYYRIVF